MNWQDLIVADEASPFAFVDPPFNRNAAAVAQYPPEVTGYHLLDSMRGRLGWASFEGRRLLDLGCGVRFARTIHNLNLPFSQYAGVDVDKEMISWLQAHLPRPRFRFEHLNARNRLYNPHGLELGPEALVEMGLEGYEATCMFSVITHQSPAEAQLTFAQVRRVMPAGGQLYFTALVDEGVESFSEADPNTPGMLSTYHTGHLVELVQSNGWGVVSIHPTGNLQQTAFACCAI